MYRINEILTPQERMAAIRVGMMRKLASMGIGPKQFVGMVKSSEDKGSLIKTLLLLSFGIGVPVGVASYAVESRLKPKRDSNRDYKRRLDAYNDVVTQLSPKKEDEEKKDDQENNAPQELGYGSSGYSSYSTPYNSYEKVATSPILTGGLAGLLGGGSVAAIQALLSDYLEAKRQKKLKEQRESTDVSPDTVVLYLKNKNGLGQKVAEALGVCGPEVKVEPTTSSKEVRVRPSCQPREVDGRYASVNPLIEKKGLARAVNNGLWIASAIAAAPFGYTIVRKISDRLEEKRLKAQVEAAQKEYVDLLSGEGDVKVAEAFYEITDISSIPGMEKTAGVFEWVGEGVGQSLDDASKNSPEVRGTENVLSMGIAAAVLSGLASAYITNRSLHKNFDPVDKGESEDEEEKAKQPVKRVLFKGASGETYEITPEQALTTIMVLRDCIADSTPLAKQADFLDWASRTWDGTKKSAKKWVGSTAQKAVDELPPEWANSSAGDYIADKFITPDKARQVLKEYEDNMRNGRPISAEQKGFIFELIKNHPDKWLGMMGSDEFKNMRQLSVDYWLDKKAKGSGFLSTMLNIPIIGDLTRYIAGLYARNTAAGRKKVALEALVERGMTREEAAKVLERYDFTGHGTGWALKQDYDVGDPQQTPGQAPGNQGQQTPVQPKVETPTPPSPPPAQPQIPAPPAAVPPTTTPPTTTPPAAVPPAATSPAATPPTPKQPFVAD